MGAKCQVEGAKTSLESGIAPCSSPHYDPSSCLPLSPRVVGGTFGRVVQLPHEVSRTPKVASEADGSLIASVFTPS